MAYLVQRDDDVCATGVTAHGLIDAAGRPMRLPDWLATSRPGTPVASLDAPSRRTTRSR
jgi:hypothetical protein